MTEKTGHFEQGRWVIDEPPKASALPAQDPVEKRLVEATRSVIDSIDDVMNAAHDLMTTPEGQQYIDRTLRDTQVEIQKSLDDILRKARDELEKTKSEIGKAKDEIGRKIRK